MFWVWGAGGWVWGLRFRDSASRISNRLQHEALVLYPTRSHHAMLQLVGRLMTTGFCDTIASEVRMKQPCLFVELVRMSSDISTNESHQTLHKRNTCR